MEAEDMDFYRSPRESQGAAITHGLAGLGAITRVSGGF